MKQTIHPANRTRRQLLKSAAVALPMVSAAGAQAAVAGNNARSSWANQSHPTTLAQAYSARFSNAFINALSATPLIGNATGFYAPDPGTQSTYSIAAEQTKQDILGVPGKATTIWGYRNFETSIPTAPGRSFEVTHGKAIQVSWFNLLLNGSAPLPHILPVDQTIAIRTPDTGVPLAIHHHGGDNAFEFDGGPDQWQTPLRRQVGPGISKDNIDPSRSGIRYEYSNLQEASLHWYHDHAESITRINVQAGLAGLYVVRDDNEAALIKNKIIPGAPYELGLVLQDRCFDAYGNLIYSADPADYPVPGVQGNLPPNNPTHMPEFFGDVIVVNGKAWPNLRVEPRAYRFRLLNGSDSRFYTLNFGPAKVYQIGTELGMLNYAVQLNEVTIAPGERVDLVLDFSSARNASFVVSNSAPTPFPFGDPTTGGAIQIMRIQVTLPLDTKRDWCDAPRLTTTLLRRTSDSPYQLPAVSQLAAAKTQPLVRRILLGEGVDQYGRITAMLGTFDPSNSAANRGTLSFQDPATELPQLGSTEIWEFINVTPDSHPVHMHLVRFQIIDRRRFTGPILQATTMSNGWTGVKALGAAGWDGPAVNAPKHEEGWKDTVVCPPDTVTRVKMTFNRRGKYVYHCHILSHEDHDMMRWYVVL